MTDAPRCITDNRLLTFGLSWCERKPPAGERVFTDVEHAAQHGRVPGSSPICPECARRAIEALRQGE